MIRKKEGVRVKRNWGQGTGEVKFGFLLWMIIQSLLQERCFNRHFFKQIKKTTFFVPSDANFFFKLGTMPHCTILCQFYDFPVSRAQDTQSWKTFVSCTGRRSEFDSHNDTNRTDSGWILRFWSLYPPVKEETYPNQTGTLENHRLKSVGDMLVPMRVGFMIGISEKFGSRG